jgi:hypothetical protein
MAITVDQVNSDILVSVDEQIADLHLIPDTRAALTAILTELNNLKGTLGGIPNDVAVGGKTILDNVIATLQDVFGGTSTLQDSASVFGNLDTLKSLMAASTSDPRYLILTSVITQLQQLATPRPDVAAVMADLQLMKSLAGGPADVTAFHDYNVLQIAFEDVWTHVSNRRLKSHLEELYQRATALMENSGMKNLSDAQSTPLGNLEQLQDLDDLNEFLTTIQSLDALQDPGSVGYLTFQQAADSGTVKPSGNMSIYPEVMPVWNVLRDADRQFFNTLADYTNNFHFWAGNSPTDNWQGQYATFKGIVDARLNDIIKGLPKASSAGSASSGSRLQNLIREIGQALAEPYAFDVFAPYSYNFGILLTYRQQWDPISYQAGDLRATIPLAPGETRKYTKKTHVTTSRAVKEMEKSMSSRSAQSSIISRAESEIMNRSTTSTNFRMTANGSFNIGVVGISATSEFALNQATEAASTKKAFHEATTKAAEEYRLERALEVDTTTTVDTEDTASGEIANPNNEITVTYLFYELQRTYWVSEDLYRARPVILVAQEVPRPDGIDEAWLLQYQWIIARVLLDDSLRPALTYLTTGFAGDELSLEVLKAQWEHLASVARSLEAQLNSQLAVRDYYRNQLISDTYRENLAKVADDNVGFFGKIAEDALGNITGAAVDTLDAARKYTESVLQNVNDNIADSQNKLREATDAYGKATDRYSAALQQQFNRHEAIDQLRVHVKQNIIYYMQAIWDHEPADQRYFRLYNLPIACPTGDMSTAMAEVDRPIEGPAPRKYVMNLGARTDNETRVLKDIADLDNPLGYKGNYMIFPLKQPLWITTFMLQEFISDTYGLQDPDRQVVWADNKSIAERGAATAAAITAAADAATRQRLAQEFVDYMNAELQKSSMVIVPTGQLFIEALTGTHPVLEDFKLLHRAEDVRKVKAEVRHAELENLRLASRLTAAQDSKAPANAGLLGDPDIEKMVVVTDGKTVTVDG